MQKIGLTGATGHLGSVLQQDLRARAIPHKLLLRKSDERFVHEEYVLGDLSNDEALSHFVQGCTAVIHSAGMVWPRSGKNPKVVETNLEGTKRLFKHCQKQGVKHFVFISSIHSMVSPSQDSVFDETADLASNPLRPYDYSKGEAERFLLAQDGMKITIINPTAIIGPGDVYLRSMNQLFNLLNQNKLPMVTAGGYWVIDVRTVAEALVKVVENSVSGKFILGGQYYAISELAKMYGDINGLNGNKRVMPAWLMRMVAGLSTLVEPFVRQPLPLNSYSVDTLLNAHPNISSSHAESTFGIKPIPIEQTLRDVHLWLNSSEAYA